MRIIALQLLLSRECLTGGVKINVKIYEGVVTVGDVWDYKLWKAEKVWDLANRIIPPHAEDSGAWTEDRYLVKVQETLKNCTEVINAIFKEDTPKG